MESFSSLIYSLCYLQIRVRTVYCLGLVVCLSRYTSYTLHVTRNTHIVMLKAGFIYLYNDFCTSKFNDWSRDSDCVGARRSGFELSCVWARSHVSWVGNTAVSDAAAVVDNDSEIMWSVSEPF